MNVEIGTEDALFPEKEYINGIFVAVYKGNSNRLHIRIRKSCLYDLLTKKGWHFNFKLFCTVQTKKTILAME